MFLYLLAVSHAGILPSVGQNKILDGGIAGEIGEVKVILQVVTIKQEEDEKERKK